jgi:hypothetical protein
MAALKVLLCLGVISAILLMETVHEMEAKGSRRTSSRRTSSRTTSRKQKTKSVSAPKPKQKTFHSSVAYSKITQGPRKPFNARLKPRLGVLAASGAVAYTLLNSPVYNGRYRPYHESSNIVIPKHRAVRVGNETYKVVTKNGFGCKNGELAKYNEDSVVNVTTEVSYEKVKGAKDIPPIKMTDTKRTNLTLSPDAINDYVTKIEIRISFNQSILTNATSNATDFTNCTIMQYESYAYVVESFALRNEINFVLFQFALLLGTAVINC